MRVEDGQEYDICTLHFRVEEYSGSCLTARRIQMFGYGNEVRRLFSDEGAKEVGDNSNADVTCATEASTNHLTSAKR